MMYRCGLQIIFTIFALICLSGCGLPLPSQNANRDPCLQPGPCPDGPAKCEADIIIRKMNALRCEVKDGCYFSAVILGEAYLKGNIDGYRINQDAWRALYWYRRAAEKGVTLAMVQVGNFYRDGIGMEACPLEAKCWYERAAKLGDVTAMLALAEMYRGGNGVKQDDKQALCWYERAMNCGSSEAEFQMGLLLMKKHTKPSFCKGLNLIVKTAEQGNPEAVSALGDLYYEGRFGHCRNINAARDYYMRAAGMGSAEGAFKLGMMYATGQSVDKNHNTAAKWFMLAAERNYSPAELYMGDLYREGRGVPKNYNFAVVWYNKAADHGVIPAYVALGDLFLIGKGVPRILEQAAHLYQVASEHNGDPYADLMLSVMHEEGRGAAFDMEKSVFYYQRARKKPGFLMAEYKIARRYAQGIGLPYNMDEAVRWYTYAADKGLVIAAVELGDLFYAGENGPIGEGVIIPVNYDVAYAWYSKAARQGHPYAQYMVGMMTLQGQGVVPDPEEASVWIHKAAYQGQKQAQYQLGLMYLEGVGVHLSNVQAYAWFDIALKCVEDAPPLLIKETVDRMDPDTRIKAVALAKKYQSKYTAHVQFPSR